MQRATDYPRFLLRRSAWRVERLAVAVLLCVGSLMTTVAAAAGRRDTTGLNVGDRPPSFSSVDLRGERQSLQQHDGKVVVLHFWASWCPYCRGEVPKLKQVVERWEADRVQVLAVSVDENLGALQRYLAEAGLPYPIIPDVEQDFALADRYNISGIPVTYVLTPHGRIAARFRGPGDIVVAVQRALRQ